MYGLYLNDVLHCSGSFVDVSAMWTMLAVEFPNLRVRVTVL
jgi:hypothetical protein